MHTVSIDLRFKYAGNLSPAEKHPQLRCFLDARFDREPVVVQLDKKEDHVYEATVKGSLSKSTTVIPPTAALCFASMAWRPNDDGTPCILDTGVSDITLGELARKQLPYQKTMDLVMHTVGGLCKGRIALEICAARGLRLDSLVPVQDSIFIDAHVVPHITNFINATMAIEESLPETFKGTSNMRIPYDYSESGIQTTLGTPLPAVAFVMSETPKSNVKYWENAFEMVMKRDDLRPEDWNRLNVTGKARATIATICYATHYMDYVADTVDRNTRFAEYDKNLVQPCENFGGYGPGDCEDLAGMAGQANNAFLSQNFDHHPALSEMQRIARNYVPPLSLDVVRGAQVSDNVVHYGAHMNDNFIPIEQFHRWLENTRDGRQVSKTLPKEKDQIDNLPFLVGEGTGMYEPFGYDNPLLPIMSYVYRAPSLNFAKKPILHKKGEPGSFFVGSLVGLTDYFYRRGATTPMSFWYCTKQPSGALTRGASYKDMMNESACVALKVQPVPDRKIMDVTKEAILKRVPPDALILTKSHADTRGRHSILERIVQDVASKKRTPGPLHQKASVYVRPHHLNERVGNQIIGDMFRMDRIWKVDYKLEEITDKLWGYQVNFYVN